MKKELESQATDGNFVEFAGRKFPDTVEGRAQLKGYGEALSTLVGKQSNEVGQARKQLQKFQRIESSLPEPVKMILESEEASQDAKLLAQYMYQEKLKSSQIEDSSRQNDWYSAASESVLEALPELKDTLDVDLIDAYLKKHAIHEAEDPLGEALRLLTPKARRKAADEGVREASHVSVDASSPRSTQSNSPKTQPSAATAEDYFFKALETD